MSGNHKVPVKYRGVNYASMADLCRAHNMSYRQFVERRKVGWTVEQALGHAPPKTPMNWNSYTINGVKYANAQEVAHTFGICPATFTSRIKHGWLPEEAITPVNGKITRLNRGKTVRSYHIDIHTDDEGKEYGVLTIGNSSTKRAVKIAMDSSREAIPELRDEITKLLNRYEFPNIEKVEVRILAMSIATRGIILGSSRG